MVDCTVKLKVTTFPGLSEDVDCSPFLWYVHSFFSNLQDFTWASVSFDHTYYFRPVWLHKQESKHTFAIRLDNIVLLSSCLKDLFISISASSISNGCHSTGTQQVWLTLPFSGSRGAASPWALPACSEASAPALDHGLVQTPCHLGLLSLPSREVAPPPRCELISCRRPASQRVPSPAAVR